MTHILKESCPWLSKKTPICMCLSSWSLQYFAHLGVVERSATEHHTFSFQTMLLATLSNTYMQLPYRIENCKIIQKITVHSKNLLLFLYLTIFCSNRLYFLDYSYNILKNTWNIHQSRSFIHPGTSWWSILTSDFLLTPSLSTHSVF